MRILQINAVGQTGSTGRNCMEMQNYINTKTMHRCYTAFAQGEKTENSFMIGNSFDRKMHAVLSRVSGKQAHYSLKATKQLLNYMDKIVPDVVLLGNLHGNFIHFPILLKYLANNDIATIVILHDCWFYTGKCTHYTEIGCLKWKTGCDNCPKLKDDNPSWFYDRTKYLWKEKKVLFSSIPRLGVIGVSDWITNESKSSLLECAKSISRIYNWIDLESFMPQNHSEKIKEKYDLKNKKVLLGVANEWGNAKGLDKFIVLSKLLGEEYRIVLVGKMTSNIILPYNITCIPSTTSLKKLSEIYSMADVFITMSVEESFGKVSAEALACGTPVVCFDSTANKELVGDCCGKVVNRGDLYAMKEAILGVCNRGKNFYVEPCRAYAVGNFSKRDRIKDYISVCERLVENKNVWEYSK